MKWIIVIAIVVIALGLLAPQLSRLGLWRLPGDFRFRYKGREYYLPIATTILLSLLLTLIARVLHV